MIWRVMLTPPASYPGAAIYPEGIPLEVTAERCWVDTGSLVFSGDVVTQVQGRPQTAEAVVRAFAPGTWASCEWVR